MIPRYVGDEKENPVSDHKKQRRKEKRNPCLGHIILDKIIDLGKTLHRENEGKRKRNHGAM